jgi:hypothetical protein
MPAVFREEDGEQKSVADEREAYKRTLSEETPIERKADKNGESRPVWDGFPHQKCTEQG